MLPETALQRIQNILDVDEKNLPILTELMNVQIDILMEKLGSIPVPASLTFIVVETTIARYRRVGAEGISDKKIDAISNAYLDDLFAPYEGIISKYATPTGDKSKSIVRLI